MDEATPWMDDIMGHKLLNLHLRLICLLSGVPPDIPSYIVLLDLPACIHLFRS